MAGSLPLKNDVQLVTQFPQSRRQALDVLSAAESVLPISDPEVTCGPMTRPATLNSSATSSSNSTDFSSSSSSSSGGNILQPTCINFCLLLLLLLARIAARNARLGLFCLCVGHDRQPCRMAEPIEIPFGEGE